MAAESPIIACDPATIEATVCTRAKLMNETEAVHLSRELNEDKEAISAEKIEFSFSEV